MIYEDFLKNANCGLIFVKLLYPLSKLKSHIHKNNYTHIGFYAITDYYSTPSIAVNFIDLYNGLLTPNWYRNEFTLDELIEDKLLDKISLKPYKGNINSFKDFLKTLYNKLSNNNIDNLLSQIINEDKINEWDIMGSFIDCLNKNKPIEIIKGVGIDYGENEKFSNVINLKLIERQKYEIMRETESALFIEKTNINKIILSMINFVNDVETRNKIAEFLLHPDEMTKLEKIKIEIDDFFKKFNEFIKFIDNGMIIGEINKNEFYECFKKLEEAKISNENNIVKFNNLEKSNIIKFSPVNNHNENNLQYMHQLLSSIVSDCEMKRENIKIPINDLIASFNQLCEGTNILPINKVNDGSYGSYIVTTEIENERLEEFKINQTTIKLIPTMNANLSVLNDEQLDELNQQLTKIKNSKYTSLKTKVTREIAERKLKICETE
jgi:hypothetical protein